MATQPQMEMQGVVLPLRRSGPASVIPEAELRGDVTPLHAVCAADPPTDVLASGPVALSRFGDWLVHRGVIDRSGLFQGLQRSGADGCRIGDALVELGLVERRVLELEACMFNDHCVCRSKRGPDGQEPPTLREGSLPAVQLAQLIAPRRKQRSSARVLVLVALFSSLLTAAGAWSVAALTWNDPDVAAGARCECSGQPPKAAVVQPAVVAAGPARSTPRSTHGATISVVLRLVSSPSGATVVDELGLSRGRTPMKLLTPQSSKPLQLQVTKRGYQRVKLNIVPKSAGVHRVVLRRYGAVNDGPKRWGQR
jgi:hypothetical protein